MSAKNFHIFIIISAVLTSILLRQAQANTPSETVAGRDIRTRLAVIMNEPNSVGYLPKTGVTLDCINGSELRLDRQEKTLFILLWKTDDPNAAAFRAFGNLFFAGFNNPKALFLAINLDRLSQKKKVVAELLKNPCLSAQVIAAEPANKVLREFVDMNIKKATLTIVQPTGQIQYFGNPGDLEPQEILRRLWPKVKKTESILHRKKTIKVDEDEFNPQAEKLIEHARTFFRISNRMIAARSYGRPIEMCRRVIQDYPDTKYADEARLLLRKVPERYHRRYKITDEELGL
jgi:hypothetical protein